jgi:hypothetical protein
MEQDGTPAAPLGFNALTSRRYSQKNPPPDFLGALAQVNQEFVAFCAKQFVEAGIPSSRLYNHVPAPAPQDSVNAPIRIAFNPYSRPGWTTYPVMTLAASFEPLYSELKAHGNPPWGGVEANAGFPGARLDWETYLAWHFNHGAMLVGINCGATGTDLPARLSKSAFGEQAVAAYRKFLRGEPLDEKAASASSALFEAPLALRAKIERIQKQLPAWVQAHGRERVEPLMKTLDQHIRSQNLTEAEKTADRVLELIQK